MNLVPFSDAWDAHVDEQQESDFSSLLPNLGCSSLNSQGMIIQYAKNENEENKRYRLYLATDIDDLPPIAQLTIDVFDATAITLSTTSDWSAFEKVVMSPAIGMYNAYAQAVGYTEVLFGLRKRMRNRIPDGDVIPTATSEGYDWLAPLIAPDTENSNSAPNEREKTTLEEIAARSSLILALARQPSDESPGEDVEVVASVELRLQPTDAKIPFSQPWLDKLERRLVNLIPFVKGRDKTSPAITVGESYIEGKSKNPPLRPYLCNLAVSPSLRSLGIGRGLCRIVESIAQQKWGYSHIYLHVDPANDAARALYEKEGYVDVGRRWNVLWAGGANCISYYVKKIGR